MALVKLRIEVNPDAETETLGDITNYVNSTATNTNLANTSIKASDGGVFTDIPTSEFSGRNSLSLAQPLVFTSDGYLTNQGDTIAGVLGDEENPNQFIWGAVPEGGEYSVKLTFTNASSLKDIVVYGDSVAKQFPTKAIVDNSTILYSDDAKWTIDLQTESDTHTIEFTQWNRENYNAVISLIEVTLQYYDIDKFYGLKSIESTTQSTGQTDEIFYGSIASDGSVEFQDVDGELNDLVIDEIIPSSNLGIQVIVNGNVIQHHITESSSYGSYDKVFNGELTNIISSFDDYNINCIKYDYLCVSLLSVTTYIMQLLGYDYEDVISMLDTIISYGGSNNLEDSVSTYLQSIVIPAYSIYSENSSIDDIITQICSIAQLNLLQNDDGTLKFISARPKKISTDKAIVIPKRCQFSTPSIDIINKNKYDNVQYTKRTLSYSMETILDETIEISYDDDGNIDLESLESLDSPQIITQNETNYLCFFKTVSTSGEMLRLDMNYTDTQALHYEWSSDDASTSGGSSSFYTINMSKDDYDFTYQGAVILSQESSSVYSELLAFKLPIPTMYTPTNLELVINGRVYDFSTTEIEYNDNENVYDITSNTSSNTLLHNDIYTRISTNNTINQYSLIAENIINDYSEGIYTTELTIGCLDYYYADGSLAKDWSNGEIFKIGEIVRIDKDNEGTSLYKYKNGQNRYWKITGRTFRYEGVPMIDLELQQVTREDIGYIVGERIEQVDIEGVSYTHYQVYANAATTNIYYTTDGSKPTKNSNVIYGGNVLDIYVSEEDSFILTGYTSDGDYQSSYQQLHFYYNSSYSIELNDNYWN